VNQRVPDVCGFDLGHEFLHEFVVDRFVNDEVAEACAALAGCSEGAPVGAGDSVVNIGGRHDHKRVFASEFKRAGHEVSAAGLADHFPDSG